jgi:uncharacterized protein (TIGR03546 family)
MLTLIAKILKVLNSEDSPAKISLAVVLAAFIGLTPLDSPHNLFILLIVLFLRINLTMFLIGFGLFTLVAYLMDPISHTVGLMLLQSDALNSLWTTLYNTTFWRLMAFNNSIVIGSFIICCVISAPLFFTIRLLVVNYRTHIMDWIKKSRPAIWIKSGKLFSVYAGLKG